MKLMLKWPGLYYMPSAFAPKYYPKAIIDFANTRGADKIMYAGYYPMGLSLRRIFEELPNVPFHDEVWPKFLRDNAVRVLKLDVRDDSTERSRRIDYAGSVHDEREIEAVVEVLRGGPTALRIGRNVRAMEAAGRRAVRQAPRRDVQLGRRRRCTSPSRCSASSRATRSSPRRSRSPPTSRRCSAPAWCRRSSTSRPTRSRSMSTRIEEMIGPRTKAILAPNLIGNAPDWDRIRADRRPPRPQGRRGLLRRPRSHAAGHADRHAGPTSASPASPCRTSSPRRAPAAWCASTTTSWPTRRCCCAGGVAARRCSCSARRRASTSASSSHHRRRPRVRQPVHLRRGGLELRAVRAVGRVRAGAARQARRQPRAPPAQLRAHQRRTSPAGRSTSPFPS